MPDIDFGVEGISKLFRGIDPDKASGPDQMTAGFLKETANQIASIYCHLY